MHPPTSEIDKKLKNTYDNIFLNSTKFKTFSRNLTSLISDHLPQLVILKNFHRNSTVTNNIVYERNYRFFNENEFKNDLRNISHKNILSQVIKLTCQQVQRLICFSNKLISFKERVITYKETLDHQKHSITYKRKQQTFQVLLPGNKPYS